MEHIVETNLDVNIDKHWDETCRYVLFIVSVKCHITDQFFEREKHVLCACGKAVDQNCKIHFLHDLLETTFISNLLICLAVLDFPLLKTNRTLWKEENTCSCFPFKLLFSCSNSFPFYLNIVYYFYLSSFTGLFPHLVWNDSRKL